MNRFMWQPAQSRCLDFAEQARASKAFSHSLGRDEAFPVAIKWPESGRPNLAATPQRQASCSCTSLPSELAMTGMPTLAKRAQQ
jgi:hypothetical protein